jgi:hypothetical protein
MANRFTKYLGEEPAPATGRFSKYVTQEEPSYSNEDDGNYSLGDALIDGATNIPSSAAAFGNDLLQAVTHPVNTADAMFDLAAGGISRGIEGATGLDLFPENKATAVADAAGQFYGDRYGSWEGFKKALGSDPVGVASDISLPFTGGSTALLKAGQVAGKTAQIGSKAATAAKIATRAGNTAKFIGDVLDPVTLAGKGAGKVVQGVASVSSGLGMDPIRAAYDAARAGGAKSKAFYDNMRGRVGPEDVLHEANLAAENIEAAGQAAYRRDISSSIANPAPIDWAPIGKAYKDVISSLHTSTGKFFGGDAAKAMRKKVSDTINGYFQDPANHTIEGLDALKKELQGLEVKNASELTASQGQANRIATRMAQAVKDEIVRLDPKYARTMENYEQMANTMRQLTDTFKTGGKASIDTALRRLQSTMRNNAYTSYGYRGRLLDELDNAGNGTLRPALAGQAMNAWEPRGIARAGGAFAVPATIAGIATSPAWAAAVLPFLPAASPRVVGEVAGLLGDTAGRLDRAPTAVKAVTKTAKAATSRPARAVAAKAQNWVMEDAHGNRYDINGNLVE